MSVSDQTERRAKWRALVEEQEKSGVSQIEFCKQRNISAAQLSYYRGLNKKEPTQSKKMSLFSPVKIKNIGTKLSDEIKIILPNGYQCYLPMSMEITQIKRLMEALLSC